MLWCTRPHGETDSRHGRVCLTGRAISCLLSCACLRSAAHGESCGHREDAIERGTRKGARQRAFGARSPRRAVRWEVQALHPRLAPKCRVGAATGAAERLGAVGAQSAGPACGSPTSPAMASVRPVSPKSLGFYVLFWLAHLLKFGVVCCNVPCGLLLTVYSS